MMLCGRREKETDECISMSVREGSGEGKREREREREKGRKKGRER